MKILKRLFKILICFILVILIMGLVLLVNGTYKKRNAKADAFLSSWMADMPDDARIINIAIPGSHDAGTAGVLWLAETQGYSIEEQLSFGTRYFDIRVNKTDDGYPMYHSIFNGEDFRVALKAIKAFIKDHPSETILLDFQHFKNDSKADVYEILKTELKNEGLALVNGSGQSDLEFINQLTLGQARGKCIVFFGESSEDPSDWVFLRNNDDCSIADMSLDSYYIGAYHKGGFSSLTEKAHPVYFALLLDKKNSSDSKNINGVFVLQCQLTDGKFAFGPWAVERAQEKKMSEYISEFSNASLNQYDIGINDINVILRDFLTPQKCEEIIALNDKKTFE